jgi:hypothetical protein
MSEDVRTGQTEEFLKALGMREVILENHSNLLPHLPLTTRMGREHRSTAYGQ